MKKRIITLCMAVMLLAVFAVSAFAAPSVGIYNGVELPVFPYSQSEMVLIRGGGGADYTMISTNNHLTYNTSSNRIVIDQQPIYLCSYRNSSGWAEQTGYVYDYYDVTTSNIVWSNFDLKTSDGSILMTASPVEYPLEPVGSSDFGAITTQLTGQINVQHIVSLIALVVTACVGLAFMWWGVRKAIAAIMAAFRKGKINL